MLLKPLKVVSAAALMAAAGAAGAHGSLALGQPADVANQGIAMGLSVNWPDAATARAKALEQCRTNKDSTEYAHGLCRVVQTFAGECGTLALDPQAGTPGFGWAVARTREEAEGKALSMCRETAGDDRQDFCKVSTTKCDAGK